MPVNIPADVGAGIEAIDTPCLLIDLDAYERNIQRMARFIRDHDLRHRAHAKTHKSADIAHDQMAAGAVGVCCQKVSEAEALVHGGVRDVLVSNEVVNPHMIERLAAMAQQARVLVCADDAANVDALAAAAARYDARLEVLVEIDVGAGRCGVAPGAPAVALAEWIDAVPHLAFAGLQAFYPQTECLRLRLQQVTTALQLLDANRLRRRNGNGQRQKQ